MIDIKIYKLIGEIHNVISISNNIDEAFSKCLKLIIASGYANFGVLWYENKTDSTIHPHYWVCPVDLTGVVLDKNDNDFGKCLLDKQPLSIEKFTSKNEVANSCFNKLIYSEMNIVPFSISDNTEGLITVIKSNGHFSDDEKEVHNILVLFVETLIKDKFVNTEWTFKNKIMSVNGVKKEFINGGVTTQVLKGIDLEIFEGEFLCLLGESGCGKSTFLNILGGLDKATSGDVMFLDTNLSKATPNELTKYRRDNVGFIFQTYNLMPNLTAKENLELIGDLVENPLNTSEILKIVRLDDKANNYPSQLSGGQQQRVSIARALIKNPKIIFADEPTAALDYSTSIEVLTALENVLEKKTTLVMVTHNEEIAKMADRVVRFRNGKIYDITVNNKKLKASELIW